MKEQAELLPAVSVAVQLTGVVPAEKGPGAGGTQTRLGLGSQLSVAVTMQLTGAVHTPAPVGTVGGGEQVIVGAVVSGGQTKEKLLRHKTPGSPGGIAWIVSCDYPTAGNVWLIAHHRTFIKLPASGDQRSGILSSEIHHEPCGDICVAGFQRQRHVARDLIRAILVTADGWGIRPRLSINVHSTGVGRAARATTGRTYAQMRNASSLNLTHD